MRADVRACIQRVLNRMERDELLDQTAAINRLSLELKKVFPEMKREQRRRIAAAHVHKAIIKRSN